MTVTLIQQNHWYDGSRELHAETDYKKEVQEKDKFYRNSVLTEMPWCGVNASYKKRNDKRKSTITYKYKLQFTSRITIYYNLNTNYAIERRKLLWYGRNLLQFKYKLCNWENKTTLLWIHSKKKKYIQLTEDVCCSTFKVSEMKTDEEAHKNIIS